MAFLAPLAGAPPALSSRPRNPVGARRPAQPRAGARRMRAAPRMVSTQRAPATEAPEVGPPDAAALEAFRRFFLAMPGVWNSQRTYHYPRGGPGGAGHEDSQTTFEVGRLDPAARLTVLRKNQAPLPPPAAALEGFRLAYLTRMESQQQLVRETTDLVLAVRGAAPEAALVGDYYRDIGYEEKRPTAATFVFEPAAGGLGKLTLRTNYEKVVSLDTIFLVNDRVRTRTIMNYLRPPSLDQPLTEPVLCGFGLEIKAAPDQRLVSD